MLMFLLALFLTVTPGTTGLTVTPGTTGLTAQPSEPGALVQPIKGSRLWGYDGLGR